MKQLQEIFLIKKLKTDQGFCRNFALVDTLSRFTS